MPIGGAHGGQVNGTFQIPEGTYLSFLVPQGARLNGGLAQRIENTGIIPRGSVRITYGPGDMAPEHVLFPPGWGTPTTEQGVYATTVDRPTYLSDIVHANMGYVVWTACRD